MFPHDKAAILYFLAVVWLGTWATTAMSQGFKGR